MNKVSVQGSRFPLLSNVWREDKQTLSLDDYLSRGPLCVSASSLPLTLNITECVQSVELISCQSTISGIFVPLLHWISTRTKALLMNRREHLRNIYIVLKHQNVLFSNNSRNEDKLGSVGPRCIWWLIVIKLVLCRECSVPPCCIHN